MYSPSREEFVTLAKEGTIIPLYKEISGDMETPVSAFKKVKKDRYSYLLESVEGGQHLGRYSFIGIDYHGVVKCKDEDFILKNKDGEVVKQFQTTNPLKELKKILDDYQAPQIKGLPRFYGGAVGYLSYDIVKYFEDIPQGAEDDLELPEVLFVLSDTLLIFDHLHHSIKVVSNIKIDGELDRAYEKGMKKIENIISKLRSPLSKEQPDGIESKEFNFQSNTSKEDFMESVDRAKNYILEGDIFQVVLSQRLEAKTEAKPFDIYRELRRVNPSPYMYYLDFGDFNLVGSSPELLVRVEDGIIDNRPIAGTRRRGRDAKEDEELAKGMLADKKERAEHIMLVDLGRNDVGKVSEYGKVEVDQLMKVEYYSHVMHMVSNVKGQLRADEDIYSALEACFPAGTVSGAPKIRAMEIIDELEKNRRGPYAGSIGYFGYSGNLDSCITIRTILVKDGKAYVQAGAGIVADSKPESEYQETLNKAEALLEAVRLAGGGGRE
ncbi:anthranilate synthase component I [Halonatronum saccharophilum]|uniref:anthranilate synthase component I n=1 Tax=Halonatronum saccharophilum TaxID=150060 RepID=UPI0004836D5B|nr:anthranilate synthase component I [Halonatronum saccharophilum]